MLPFDSMRCYKTNKTERQHYTLRALLVFHLVRRRGCLNEGVVRPKALYRPKAYIMKLKRVMFIVHTIGLEPITIMDVILSHKRIPISPSVLRTLTLEPFYAFPTTTLSMSLPPSDLKRCFTSTCLNTS